MKRKYGEKGIGLVEIMVATLIGAFMSAGAVTVFLTGERVISHTGRRMEAVNLCQDKMEDLIGKGFFAPELKAGEYPQESITQGILKNFQGKRSYKVEDIAKEYGSGYLVVAKKITVETNWSAGGKLYRERLVTLLTNPSEITPSQELASEGGFTILPPGGRSILSGEWKKIAYNDDDLLPPGPPILLGGGDDGGGGGRDGGGGGRDDGGGGRDDGGGGRDDGGGGGRDDGGGSSSKERREIPIMVIEYAGRLSEYYSRSNEAPTFTPSLSDERRAKVTEYYYNNLTVVRKEYNNPTGWGPGSTMVVLQFYDKGGSLISETAEYYGPYVEPYSEPKTKAGTEAKKSTVICTELYRYGFIPEHIYEADARYGASLPPEVIRGYHLWGKPIARMMQKSRVFAYFVYILARPWIQQMAYEMAATDRGSKLGKLMIKIGEPFCAYLGERER
ncbi:MAG: hypothetical protein NC818_04340 [Candidatus Omnitrophica bacterium]|nr:hypothetical protein [Candidatus Omnitrophota bacterium]